MNRNTVQTNTILNQKLGYIIDLLEGRARDDDPARRTTFQVNAPGAGGSTDETASGTASGSGDTPSRRVAARRGTGSARA